MNKPLAKTLSFDEDTMWVHLVDGRTIGIPLAWFPRLLDAGPEQLSRYIISGAGSGLHWDELGEDISVEHLLLGQGDRTVQSIAAK
jgi:hypothetical protein